MITLDEARRNQDKLKVEVTALLNEMSLMPYLAQFGEPEIEGSYAYGLMVRPDIDIKLINPNLSENLVTNIEINIRNTPLVKAAQIISENTDNRRQGAPKGWYIRVDCEYESKPWKIDLWVVSDGKRDEAYPISLRDPKWINQCSASEKDAILLIKAQLFEEQGDYTAANVYRAVIEGHVKNLQEFKEWRDQLTP